MNLTAEQSATLTAVAAVAWPFVQAALDRPYWTAGKRRALALVAVVLIAVGTWFVGAYPANAEAVVTQLLSVAGLVLGAFNILKSVKINGISILDWAGIVTPGGVTLRGSGEGRHAK
jgi:hypothetical protein|nr:MAG TPA: hypothetical protein [Caudoviricetes sp.]